MREAQSKIIGVTFDDTGVAYPHRQENIRSLSAGQQLYPQYEEDNPFDENAIKLYADPELQRPLGYVKREIAQTIAQQRLRGWNYWFYVKALTGGEERDRKVTGCNIRIVAERPG